MNKKESDNFFTKKERIAQLKFDLEKTQKDLYKQRKKVFCFEEEVKRLQREIWIEENRTDNGSLISSGNERKRDKIFAHIKTGKCIEKMSEKVVEIQDFEIIKKAARCTEAHLFQITEWKYVVENENSDTRYSFVIDF